MWLVYRDIKLQFTGNKVRKTQKSIVIFKSKYFQNSWLTQIFDRKIRQFHSDILRKLIPPAISETKPENYNIKFK